MFNLQPQAGEPAETATVSKARLCLGGTEKPVVDVSLRVGVQAAHRRGGKVPGKCPKCKQQLRIQVGGSGYLQLYTSYLYCP